MKKDRMKKIRKLNLNLITLFALWIPPIIGVYPIINKINLSDDNTFQEKEKKADDFFKKEIYSILNKSASDAMMEDVKKEDIIWGERNNVDYNNYLENEYKKNKTGFFVAIRDLDHNSSQSDLSAASFLINNNDNATLAVNYESYGVSDDHKIGGFNLDSGTFMGIRTFRYDSDEYLEEIKPVTTTTHYLYKYWYNSVYFSDWKILRRENNKEDEMPITHEEKKGYHKIKEINMLNDKIDAIQLTTSLSKNRNNYDIYFHDKENNDGENMRRNNVISSNIFLPRIISTKIADKHIWTSLVYAVDKKNQNRVNAYSGTSEVDLIIKNEDGFNKNLYPSDNIKSKNFKNKLHIKMKNGYPGMYENSQIKVVADDEAGAIHYFYKFNTKLVNGKIEKGEIKSLTIRGFKSTQTSNPTYKLINDNSIFDKSKVLASQVNEKDLDKLISVDWSSLPRNGYLVINQKKINDKEGTIFVEVVANEWTDKNKAIVKSKKIFHEVKITGFKTQEPTSVVENYSLENKDQQETIDDFLKNDFALHHFLIKNIFVNLPENFERNHYSFSRVKNNKDGKLTIYVTFSKFYNEKGLLVENEYSTIPFISTITGFKKLTPIRINESYFAQNHSDVLASKFSKSKNDTELENLLLELSKIDNDDLKNINYRIRKKVASNVKGELNIEIELIIPDDSIWKSPNSLFRTILIKGFKKISETTVHNSYIINSDLTPDQYYEGGLGLSRIKIELINNNVIQTLDENVTEKDIKLILKATDQINGKIILTVILNKYYDESGNLIVDSPLKKEIEISGFKKTSETKINDHLINISGSHLAESLPSELKDETNYLSIKKILINKNIFSNQPKNFDYDDIIISLPESNNELGEFKFYVGLKKYYDENGKLVTTQKKDFLGLITIKGFRKSLETIVDKMNYLDEQNSNLLATSAIETPQYIKNLLVNYVIKNKPKNLTLDDILIHKNEADNINGQVIVDFNIKKFYNENAILVTNSSKEFKSIIIKGFMKINETTYESHVDLNSLHEQIASDYVKEGNNEKIKFIISNNVLKNKPNKFSYENILINKRNFNNLKGELEVLYSLTSYYDRNGNVETKPLNLKVIISGFKKINVAEINKSFRISDSNLLYEKNVHQITNDDLKKIINENHLIKFPDKGIIVTDSLFEIGKKTKNPFNGELNVEVFLNTLYKDFGDEKTIDTPLLLKTTIYNFKKIDRSKIQFKNDINYFSLPSSFDVDKFNKSYTLVAPEDKKIKTNLIHDDLFGKLSYEINLENYNNENQELIVGEINGFFGWIHLIIAGSIILALIIIIVPSVKVARRKKTKLTIRPELRNKYLKINDPYSKNDYYGRTRIRAIKNLDHQNNKKLYLENNKNKLPYSFDRQTKPENRKFVNNQSVKLSNTNKKSKTYKK